VPKLFKRFGDTFLTSLYIYLFYLCVESHIYTYHLKFFKRKGECFLPLELNTLPVPYIKNSDGSYAIIYPNSDGYLNLDRGVTFYLSCTDGRFIFQNPGTSRIDIEVTCDDGQNVWSDGGNFNFLSFRCVQTPMSDIKVFSQECQGLDTVVAKVGFRTEHTFLPQYGICFDTIEMNSLYTWYEARVPNEFQNIDYDTSRSMMPNNPEIYKHINLNYVYAIRNQVSTII